MNYEQKYKEASKRMKHKFFRDAEHLCWWCNTHKVEVISITFVPRGGWCVFYRDKISKQ